MDKTNEYASKVLGKQVSHPEEYDPSVLVAIPRELNRLAYNIKNSDFNGYDLWNCYECSFLKQSGEPVRLIISIEYPSNSEFIVESKSLKLYLNSFNLYKLDIEGDNHDNKIYRNQFIDIVKKDLENLLKTNVRIILNPRFESLDVEVLERSVYNELKFVDQKETPSLLKASLGTGYNSRKEFSIITHNVRSNCRVTNQPDWASVYIEYAGSQSINLDSLYAYLMSFRKEAHFHEECCEMIYKRLLENFGGGMNKLLVACLYTRRGGVDINPVRYHGLDSMYNFKVGTNHKTGYQ